ncbi:MAG: alanine racemase [Candidatus Paceibacterota bacterium]|jgi:alanine racemase
MNLPLSYIEISKKNLIHNIKELKSLTKKPARRGGGGTKIVSMIKANAYGHGQNEIAKILEPHTDYFGVNSVNELEILRKVTKKKTFVLGYVCESNLEKALKLGCVLSVFSLDHFRKINKIVQKLKKIQEINISIDAYLGREGFLNDELSKFFKELKKSKYIKVVGIYAHFANIEDTLNFSHANKQIKKYEEAVKVASLFGFCSLETHISATSGLLAYEINKGIHPVIRLGIGLYGLWPSENLRVLYKNKIELKPVLSWKTKIAQIKTLPAGSTIGYGLTYKTKKETKIAVIPQGYSDGLDRGLSNKGEVLIGGTRCKILGRIAMNMFVVDVSHLLNVKVEDEVVIIGRQKDEQITVEELANQTGTINYEIVARLSALLPRIIK